MMAHVIVAKNGADRWCREMLVKFSKKKKKEYILLYKRCNFGEKNLEVNMLKCYSSHLWWKGYKWIFPTALYISVLYRFSIMNFCFYNLKKARQKARNKKIPHLIGIILNNVAANSWL